MNEDRPQVSRSIAIFETIQYCVNQRQVVRIGSVENNVGLSHEIGDFTEFRVVPNHCFHADCYGNSLSSGRFASTIALTLECRNIVLFPDERGIREIWECLLVTDKYGSSNVARGPEDEDLLVFVRHIEAGCNRVGMWVSVDHSSFIWGIL